MLSCLFFATTRHVSQWTLRIPCISHWDRVHLPSSVLLSIITFSFIGTCECFQNVFSSLQTSADLYYLNSVKRVNIKFQRMLCTFAFDLKYKRRQRSQHSTENRTCYMLCILFYWKVLEKAPVWRQILSCGWVLALCIWIWTMSL